MPVRAGAAQIELDSRHLAPVGTLSAKAARHVVDDIVRRALQHEVEAVRERRLGAVERSVGGHRADDACHVYPLGMALQEVLGREARPDLLDTVEDDDAVRPHHAGRAFGIEGGELQLVAAVDQHEIIETGAGNDLVDVDGPRSRSRKVTRSRSFGMNSAISAGHRSAP